VLDYLSHHCYPNTARAFARDSTIRHLDADGDELRPAKGSLSNTALSEAVLMDLDVRQRCILGSLNHRRLLLTSSDT
jgi:hypothetical protein